MTLGSKYPIVAMAMNQVSDINLAIAVRKAGAIPSLSIFNYAENPARIVSDLEQYYEEFGDYKILLSLTVFQLVSPRLLNLVTRHKVEFIELIPDFRDEFPDHSVDNAIRNNIIESLSKSGIKIYVKRNRDVDIPPHVAGIIVKGKEGAGRGLESTEILFNQFLKKYPHLELIVSGGIGTPEQVKYYMDHGATAIGVGTIIAASEECRISHETKLKMVNATSKDIKRFNNGADQSAIIFKELEKDNFNHTEGLAQGIKNPEVGHVFVGTSIDYINGIKPVADIINMLAERLNCE